MNQGFAFATGLAVGAGLMYWFDPVAGRRRRALVRDQLFSASSDLDECIAKTWTDVRQRAQGVAAEATEMFGRGDGAPDRVLIERTRSILGRYVSHPHAIDVTVENGKVTLSGPILTQEVDDLLCAVASIRGVGGVENQLEPHEQGDIAALQGGRERLGQRCNFMEENWAPATRLLAGALGGGLVGFGFTQRFPAACALGTLGLGLLARATTNLSMPRLLGLTSGPRTITLQKTFAINAPREEVFDLWANYDNFPRFMAHLNEVKDLGGGRSQWTAAGPAGMPVTWIAKETQFVQDEVIAWRSEPGSIIANAGFIRFESESPRATRIHIRFAYNPPAGVLGHLAALLFGADPKSAMDEDLLRMKSLLEEGKARAPGKRATREELVAAERETSQLAGVGVPLS